MEQLIAYGLPEGISVSMSRAGAKLPLGSRQALASLLSPTQPY